MIPEFLLTCTTWEQFLNFFLFCRWWIYSISTFFSCLTLTLFLPADAVYFISLQNVWEILSFYLSLSHEPTSAALLLVCVCLKTLPSLCVAVSFYSFSFCCGSRCQSYIFFVPSVYIRTHWSFCGFYSNNCCNRSTLRSSPIHSQQQWEESWVI